MQGTWVSLIRSNFRSNDISQNYLIFVVELESFGSERQTNLGVMERRREFYLVQAFRLIKKRSWRMISLELMNALLSVWSILENRGEVWCYIL